MALEAIWTEEYDVTSYLVDFRKRLSLQGLLNLLQEAAWRHAAHLGHGYEETRSVGTFWVLVRQMVQVDVWPLWEEKLSIRTWLRPPTSVVVTRDFELSVAGRPVGRAAAHWLTIDHHTRRPSPLPFPKDRGLFREDGHLSMIRSLWKCSKLTNSVLTRSIFWPKPTIATELISGRPSVEPTITFKGIGPRMTSCSLSLESKVKSHDRNSRQDRTRASGSYWSLW